jgi:hypothetical protein
MKSWQDFPIDWPPSEHGSNRCVEVGEVMHVTHVDDAFRIIEDGKVRSSLVYDESRLNTKRTEVAWVSPKWWHDGFIYGNVAFVYDWNSLVAGRKVYWVEHRKTGRQDLCRFLICPHDPGELGIERFDPMMLGGPLYFDAKTAKWYHNDSVTSEYMVLSDLQLGNCKRIEFVKHHPRWCSKDGGACSCLGLSQHDAGAELLSKLIGTERADVGNLFKSSMEPEKVDASVQGAVRKMYRRIVDRPEVTYGGTLHNGDYASVMRVALLALGWGQTDSVASLVEQYPDIKAVEASFWACIDHFFGDLAVEKD